MSVDQKVRTLQCLVCDETWDALGFFVPAGEEPPYALWRPKPEEARCPECGCTEVSEI